MEKKIETMNIQGQQYAKVKSRLQAFKTDFPKSKILTSYEFKEGFTIFRAELFPKFDDANSIGTGHAFGKIDKLKAFEKLETIAVGRALGLAGYGADGEIASFDEMQEYLEQNNIIEKSRFRKQEFNDFIDALNNGGTITANAWIEDNKDVFDITDIIQQKIVKAYNIYKKNQTVTKEEVDNEIWKDAEATKKQATG